MAWFLYVSYNAATTVTSLTVGRVIDRRTPKLGLTVGAATIAGILWTALSPAWAFGFLAAAMTIATGLLARPVSLHADA